MKNIKTQTLKGFRDFLPEKAKKRQWLIDKIKSVFESYGFEPLETPALEYEEVLLGKYGDEGDKLMYRFEDNGKRKVALRYDQTVPLARVVAQYQNDLPLPFKRYQIQNVWRGENPQKGRYREFLQCDADIIGSSSPLSDAEIIIITIKALDKLNLKDYKIFVNMRPVLEKILEEAKTPDDKKKDVIIALDKLEKNKKEDVLRDLVEKKGIDRGCIDELFRILNDLRINFPDLKPLVDGKTIKTEFKKIDEEIIAPFKLLAQSIKALGISTERIIPNFTLARGLDYYTGMIFEVEVKGYDAGSVAGGGRYDNLIGMFAGRDIPAVGFSFGFDRLIEAMEKLNLFPQNLTTTKALVTILSKELKNKSLEVYKNLRDENINAEIYLDETAPLEKQLKYADKKGIPFSIIIDKDKLALKNMKKREQQDLSLDEIIKKLN